jgi:hypothetical protein
MMAHDPQKRIADYRELTRRIDALQLQSPATLATVSLPSLSVVDAAPTPSTWVETAKRVRTKLPSVNLKWLTIAISAAAVALVLLGIASRQGSPGKRDLERSGRVEELFNGKDISQWSTVSGSWSGAKNDEGALVLQGRGVIRRPLLMRNNAGEPQSPPHYRLTFFVDLHEASAVELQFDLAASSTDGERLVVRIDRNGSLLGNCSDDQTPPLATSRRSHSASAGPLHVIQLERQSLGWWAFVDEQLLGSTPVRHAAPATEFRLLAEGGFAWFSDFTVEELVSPTARYSGQLPNAPENPSAPNKP